MKEMPAVESRVCLVREDKGTLCLVLSGKKQEEELLKLFPAGWDVVTQDIAIDAHRAAKAIQVGEAVQVVGKLWGLKIADESERGWHVKVMQTKTKL